MTSDLGSHRATHGKRSHTAGPKNHTEIQDSYKPWFLESDLSWIFEPECKILMLRPRNFIPYAIPSDPYACVVLGGLRGGLTGISPWSS